MATFIGLIMNSKCQQTLLIKILSINLKHRWLKMESKILGKLFGVDIRYPFRSSDFHDVIDMRVKKVQEWKAEGFAELQIYNFEDNEFDAFRANISPEQVVLFEEAFTYENENYVNLKVFEDLTLYGVKINYPFTHENIREAAKAQRKLEKSASQRGTSEVEAVVDSSNVIKEFYEKLTASKAIREFGNIWIIETQNIYSQEQIDSAIESQKIIQKIEDDGIKVQGFFNVIMIIIVIIAIAALIKIIG